MNSISQTKSSKLNLEPPQQYIKTRSWHMLHDGVREFPAEWCPAPNPGLKPLWVSQEISGTSDYVVKRYGWSYIGPCPTVKTLRFVVDRDPPLSEIHPEYLRMCGDIEE